MSFEIIDNENSPTTLNWRSNRLAIWEKLRKLRDADYFAAAKHTTPEAAAKYANERIRATVRAFMAEILMRSSQAAASDFVRNAPPDWIPKTERLLDDGELVPRLIRRAYPFVTWAKSIADLEKAQAAIDSNWGAWTNFYLDKLGYQVSSGFDSVGEAAGGVAGSIGGFLSSAGMVLKYAPYVLGAAGLLVVVAAVRK